jgi:DNA-binding HxlR family transcriptional regulator
VVGIRSDFNEPQLIPGDPSHGCARMREPDSVAGAAHHVGTPVRIVRRHHRCHKRPPPSDKRSVERRRPQRPPAARPRAGGASAPAEPRPPGTLGAVPAGLIARSWSISILIELAGGPCRAHELERRITGIPHTALMRRLSQLAQAGVVAKRCDPDAHRRPHLVLTAAGRELNVLAELAERWEARTRLRTRALPGMWALRTLADEHAWEILRALSQEGLHAGELARRVEPIDSTALPRRLAEHLRDGLLVSRSTSAGTVYELTDDARALAALSLPAMAWELRFSRRDAERTGRDLLAMLRLGAPLAALPTELAGVCAIRVVPDGGSCGGLWLRARSGRLTALESAPPVPPEAAGHASAPGWLYALLERRRRAITILGDEALLGGVLNALSGLSGPPRSAREAVHGGARL